jgi:thermitase
MIHGRITLSLAVSLATTLATSLYVGSAVAKVPESVPGEYVLKLKPQAQLASLVGTKSLNILSGRLGAEVKSVIAENNIVVVRRPAIETTVSAVKTLMQNPLVEVAEPNFIYRVNKTSNDPLFEKLWGMKNTGQKDSSNSPGVAGVDVDIEKAWDIETGSEKTLIAVIDTGIDYNHPDLKANAWTNEAELNGATGVDDDGNGYIDDIHGYSFADELGNNPDPMDDHGHGSHCAGTIGARGDDGAGIVGVNWQTKIMGIKFLGADGSGTLEGAIRSIDYATKMGAKILSNSWGGGGYSQTLKEAIERSNAAGALFVAAAGNDGANNDEEDAHYPSNYDVANVLSVAAIDNKGQLAYFSNYGKKRVHVAAPGVNVFSSLPGGEYASWSGTSMATPHVSGVAGLVWSHEPELTGVQVKERIIKTARPLEGVRKKVASNGLVNGFNALTNTQAPPDANDPALWASRSMTVSSPHPYPADFKEVYEIKVDGAKEFALYFDKFNTEKGYDKVTLYDSNGAKIGEMSGNNDDSFSPVIQGSYVKMVFEADGSIQKEGFDLTRVHFR